MAKPKRTPEQREADMPRIAAWYLKGWTHERISEEVGVARCQITKDIKQIRDGWRESSLVDMNEAKNKELDRIDVLEAEAWSEYERSKEDKSKHVVQEKNGAIDSFTSETTTTEGRLGDPAYLVVIDRCVQRRCKILGLEAPAQHDILVREYGLALPSDDEWDAARERGTTEGDG